MRRMLAENKLETQEIVIEPEEVRQQPDGWKRISEERTSQLDWIAPKIIKRVYIRPARYVKLERFALAPLLRPNRLSKAWSGRACWRRYWSASMNIINRSTTAGEDVPGQQFGVELSHKTLMGCWVEQAASNS